MANPGYPLLTSSSFPLSRSHAHWPEGKAEKETERGAKKHAEYIFAFSDPLSCPGLGTISHKNTSLSLAHSFLNCIILSRLCSCMISFAYLARPKRALLIKRTLAPIGPIPLHAGAGRDQNASPSATKGINVSLHAISSFITAAAETEDGNKNKLCSMTCGRALQNEQGGASLTMISEWGVTPLLQQGG